MYSGIDGTLKLLVGVVKKFFCDLLPPVHDEDGEALVDLVQRAAFHHHERAKTESLGSS